MSRDLSQKSVLPLVFWGVLSAAVPGTPARVSQARIPDGAREPAVAAGVPAKQSDQQPQAVFRLDIGLASPPIVNPDGSLWVLGRDGQLARVAGNSSLAWAISLNASVLDGSVADDDQGLLFVPTAKDTIVAMQPDARQRWLGKVPWGIGGPLAWIPEQGLAFVGRDHLLYWMGTNASVLQRASLRGRVSAGPVRVGRHLVLGLSSGELVTFVSRGQSQRTQLKAPIRSIAGAGALWATVLAGDELHQMVAPGQPSWSAAAVAAYATVQGTQEAGSSTVVLTSGGEMEWLDSNGRARESVPFERLSVDKVVSEMVAYGQCVWGATGTGEAFQYSAGGDQRVFRLAAAALLRPVLDLQGARVLFSSAAGAVWSLRLPPACHVE